MCPVCESRTTRSNPALGMRIRVDPPDALLVCATCGLGWIDREKRPVHPTGYENEYFDAHTTKVAGFAGGYDVLAPHLVERLAALEASLGEGQRSLLEVGCGSGSFLAAAHANGWTVFGIDVSRWVAARLEQRYGIRVEVGDIETAVLPSRSVDVVHLSHVLEHVGDPRRALKRLYSILRPGGLLVVEVPNELFCTYDRVRWLLLRRTGPSIAPQNPHLFFFNAFSLERLLKDCGLNVISIRSERRNADDRSQFPFGATIKKLIYKIEEWSRNGPNLVIVAQRPPA